MQYTQTCPCEFADDSVDEPSLRLSVFLLCRLCTTSTPTRNVLRGVTTVGR